jgi:hypothetical protein
LEKKITEKADTQNMVSLVKNSNGNMLLSHEAWLWPLYKRRKLRIPERVNCSRHDSAGLV